MRSWHGAEAEAVQDQGGAAVGVPGLPVLGLFQALAVGVEDCLVAGGALGHPGEFPAEPVQLGEVLAGLAQRLVQDGRDGRAGLEGHLLVQMSEVDRAGDTARVGFVHAGEYP